MAFVLQRKCLYVLVAVIVTIVTGADTKYEPNWKSLDSRPLPVWYDEAKFGIFIHWGVFSVPSFGSEWFWWQWQGSKPQKHVVDFMEKNYRKDFTYADFAPMFQAEFYDPNEWADIIKSSGAKYVVLTSKHHEGFTNWPSSYSFNWNSQDVGPKRDLVGELAASIRNNTDIHFGLYHSLFEWFNPLYLKDKITNFTTNLFVKQKAMPELYEIVNKYNPEIIWSDGDWEAPDTYWNSTSFLAWLYNESPVKETVVTNDRWGQGITCHHGGYYTCSDRFNPGTLQKHKWENCMTIDQDSWGYVRRSSLKDYLTMDNLTELMASTISCGGNLLMNIGPTHDGRIVPIFEERLRQMGDWLKINGEAIYASKPWIHQNDTVTPNVWFTSKMVEKAPPVVYAILLDWPKMQALHLGTVQPTQATHVIMLGLPEVALQWKSAAGGGISIMIPALSPTQLPCQWAWTLKLTNVMAATGPTFAKPVPQNIVIEL